MLSLLIFIGEAVRDAFDPRKTFEADVMMLTKGEAMNTIVRKHYPVSRAARRICAEGLDPTASVCVTITSETSSQDSGGEDRRSSKKSRRAATIIEGYQASPSRRVSAMSRRSSITSDEVGMARAL